MSASGEILTDPLGSAGTGRALLGLVVVVLGYLLFYLGSGAVLYAPDNRPEVGLSVEPFALADFWHEDTTSLYVPETAAHLAGDHAGWLSTWTPHNGLGRPLYQIGPSPTFVVPHVLARLTGDPFVHHTWMTALAMFGSAIFALYFLSALGLGATGAFVGAVGISLGPLFPTWDMIPLIQWGYCWTFAALLAVERWCARGSLWSLGGLAFAFHGVLLTGYLQHVLGLAWIAGAWTVLRVVLGSRDGGAGRGRARSRVTLLGGVLGAALIALVTVAPVYLDLYVEWSRSTRSTHTQVYDPARGLHQLWPHLVCAWERDQPGYIGMSFGPVYTVLAVVGLVAGRAARVGAVHPVVWAAGALLFSAATQSVSAHALLARLGFSVSDWPPVFAAHLPVAVLAGAGADVLARPPSEAVRRRAVVAAWAVMVVVGVAAAVTIRAHAARASFVLVAEGAGLAFALLVAVSLPRRRPRAALLVACCVASALSSAHNVVTWRARSSIATTSPLAEGLRERTADGSRWLWVGPPAAGRPWLPPNVDALLGTRSLASYDHMTSRAFHRWLAPLRVENEKQAYERRFRRAAGMAPLDADFFAFSGVRTLVTTEAVSAEMEQSGARRVDLGPAEVRVWEAPNPGPLAALVPFAGAAAEGLDVALSGEALRAGDARIDVDRSVDDRLALVFEPAGAERLLFLSQEHHPRWFARGGGDALETPTINGLFQGVVVPPGVGRVDLAFRPHSRWMLIPQALFALLAIGALATRLRSAGRKP